VHYIPADKINASIRRMRIMSSFCQITSSANCYCIRHHCCYHCCAITSVTGFIHDIIGAWSGEHCEVHRCDIWRAQMWHPGGGMPYTVCLN